MCPPTGSDSLPAHVAIAWGLQSPTNRGPRPGLSVDEIVTVAIAMADEGGLTSVSMSRLADRLGYTTMSLYRYVTAKEDLVGLMSDGALGRPPDPATRPRGWRRAVEWWARAILGSYRDHPWILDIPLTGTPAMPRHAAWLDVLLQSLAPSHLRGERQLYAALTVDGHVRNWAQLLNSLAPPQHSLRAAPTRIPTRAQLVRLIRPERFPALAPMIADGQFDDDTSELDKAFRFGLTLILDGISARTRQKNPAKEF